MNSAKLLRYSMQLSMLKQLRSLKPVSYTHLDVYKRQGLLKRTSVEFHQTIVMITHNDDIARLADRIIRIEDGKITGGMEL